MSDYYLSPSSLVKNLMRGGEQQCGDLMGPQYVHVFSWLDLQYTGESRWSVNI